MATRKSPSAAPKAQSRSKPAARGKASRRARKPKLIEIDGHLLTPEQHREYERYLESRQRTNRDAARWQIEKLALDDLLAKFRFSSLAHTKIPELYLQLTTATAAIMALHNYPFYEPAARSVRLTGCDALSRLAAEVQLLGAKIHAIGDAIRYEDREHLQDWVKRQAALDAASPYGLAPTVQS